MLISLEKWLHLHILLIYLLLTFSNYLGGLYNLNKFVLIIAD